MSISSLCNDLPCYCMDIENISHGDFDFILRLSYVMLVQYNVTELTNKGTVRGSCLQKNIDSSVCRLERPEHI